jgi:hypothetical protein
MPAGLDVTRSPLRPVAATVNVTDCACGVTVSAAVLAIPPALAVIVAGVDAVIALVVIAKVAAVDPCATVTLAGTVTAVVLLDSATVSPPAGAADVRVIVPCDATPPCTLAGLIDSADRDAGAAGGDTVSAALRVTPPYVPLIFAVAAAVTLELAIVNVALVAPAAMARLAGTVAAAILLLARVTTAPPDGAALVSMPD